MGARRLAWLAPAVLLAATLPALAQEPAWSSLASDPAVQIEIDAGSIRRVDGQLTGWLMFNFADEQPGRVRPYRSVLAMVAFDCEARRYAIIQGTSYGGLRGNGEVIDRFDAAPEDWQWRPADASAESTRMLDSACR